MITGIVDKYMAFMFLRILTTPWTDMEAYKLGIIDDEGNVLKKRSQLKTAEEKNAAGYFDRLVWNIKKVLGTIPLGRTRMASFAAALYLLREHAIKEGAENPNLFEDLLKEHFPEESAAILTEETMTSGIDFKDPSWNWKDDPEVKKDKFAGYDVFVCSPDTFHNCRLGKKKYGKYETYVGKDKMGEAIRRYGRENPKSPIILRNGITGSMIFLRKPFAENSS